MGSQPHWEFRDAWDQAYTHYKKATKSTIEDIAKELGRSVSALNSYRKKQGAVKPPPDVLIKASKLFNVDIRLFMPDYVAMALPSEEEMGRQEPLSWITKEAIRMLEDKDLHEGWRWNLFKSLQDRYVILKELEFVPGHGTQPTSIPKAKNKKIKI